MTLFKSAGRFNIQGYPEEQLKKLIARLQRGNKVPMSRKRKGG
jgi:hypothetical protein